MKKIFFFIIFLISSQICYSESLDYKGLKKISKNNTFMDEKGKPYSEDEIIIVLGHEKEIIKNIIQKNKKIKFVYNKNYKNGISSSIQTGLRIISKKMEAFFICLGDMPDVNQNIYNKMIKTKLNYNKKLKPNFKKEIFIPTYEKKNGNPVLFTKHMKEKIMQISGDDGAKELIEIYKSKALLIPVKNRGITLDFDIQEDFNTQDSFD